MKLTWPGRILRQLSFEGYIRHVVQYCTAEGTVLAHNRAATHDASLNFASNSPYQPIVTPLQKLLSTNTSHTLYDTFSEANSLPNFLKIFYRQNLQSSIVGPVAIRER